MPTTDYEQEAQLDARLARLFEARRAKGVEDIKCHVEVTSTTDLRVLKRTLANVLERAEAGQYKPKDLTSYGSFDEIIA